MRCYEDAILLLTGEECPTLPDDDAWTSTLQEWLHARGFQAKFTQIDEQAIISHRLPNGKVHADVMHPTLITTIKRTT